MSEVTRIDGNGLPRRPGRISRRGFLRAARLASGVAAGLGLYTWGWEPHWLEVVERPLPVELLPERLRGATLVQLSDLHIGPQVSDTYLLRVFQTVRSLSPDIVAYTGDFTSYETGVFDHAGRMFPSLPRGARATFGIMGNHDYGPRWAHPEIADKLTELARASGVEILRNQVGEIDGLQVLGMDDLWAKRFMPAAVIAGMDKSRAAIALSHNPDTADESGWGAFRGWILAGHTHGGQCKPPFLPPPLLPVRNRRYTAGVFHLEAGRQMYISRGVGHLLRVRFNARPEVTLFRLVRA